MTEVLDRLYLSEKYNGLWKKPREIKQYISKVLGIYF